MKCFLGVSNFLEAISSVSQSVLFLYFFPLIADDSFLISPCYFWNSAFRCLYLSFSPLLLASLLFTAICKASLDSHLAFCISFPWEWSWSLSPVQCHEPPSIVHFPNSLLFITRCVTITPLKFFFTCKIKVAIWSKFLLILHKSIPLLLFSTHHPGKCKHPRLLS